MMKSYAQNFEDVLLWRALHDVTPGFYIDLGAQHPVLDSVSKWFYEQGWRGIHVEPLLFYADLLRQDRPDEDIIQAVVSDEPGSHIMYEFPDTGLSTLSAEIAAVHKVNRGQDWVEEIVPSLTLAEIFEKSGRSEIHWLKIDVEGHERSALASWRDSIVRPWIVLIESTYPNTQIETFDEWESLLTSRGYEFVYTDGLNRYYMHEAHRERREHFRYPPNYFDGFSLGEHWATSNLRAEASAAQQQAESEKIQALRAADEAQEAARQAEARAAHRDEHFISEVSRVADELAERAASRLAEFAADVTKSHDALEKRLREIQTTTSEASDAARESRDMASQATLRAERLQSRVEQISSNFELLNDNLHRMTSSRWRMLKALLRPQKAGLLARDRTSTIGALWEESSAFGLRGGMTQINPKQKFEESGQGESILNKDDTFRALSLADMCALPPQHFIRAAYRTLLGREADTSGASHYLGRMALGDSRTDILRDIVKGREYKSRARHEDLMGLGDDEFIELAYRRVLGRAADGNGKRHYLERLQDGKSRARILNDLAGSHEARARTDPTLRLRDEIERFVIRRHGIRKWLRGFRRSPSARRISQLDFSLSTAIHRLELDLDRRMELLRAEAGMPGQPAPFPGSGFSAAGNWQRSGTGGAAQASRPRWIPRDAQTERQDIREDALDRAVTTHPDFLALSGRMRKEAPFGELRDARTGQERLGDFMEGGYSTEDHGDGPVRWIGSETSIYLRVTGPRFHIRAGGFFAERPGPVSVSLFFDNVAMGILQFDKEITTSSIRVDEWIGSNVIVRLKCDSILNPASAGINSDQRDLGILIHSAYFD